MSERSSATQERGELYLRIIILSAFVGALCGGNFFEDMSSKIFAGMGGSLAGGGIGFGLALVARIALGPVKNS